LQVFQAPLTRAKTYLERGKKNRKGPAPGKKKKKTSPPQPPSKTQKKKKNQKNQESSEEKREKRGWGFWGTKGGVEDTRARGGAHPPSRGKQEASEETQGPEAPGGKKKKKKQFPRGGGPCGFPKGREIVAESIVTGIPQKQPQHPPKTTTPRLLVGTKKEKEENVGLGRGVGGVCGGVLFHKDPRGGVEQ